MEILQKLTPAETYLLLEDKNAKIKTAVALTFMDLLLKEVLTVIQRESISEKVGELPSKQYYVVTGRNYEGYKPLFHEKSFIVFFEKDTKLEVPLSILARKTYLNAPFDIHNFINNVCKIHLAHLYPKGFFQETFRKKEFEDKRKAFVRQIKSFLDDLDKKMNQNPKDILPTIQKIHGNVLLIEGFKFQLLQGTPLEEIKEAFASYFKSQDIENEIQRKKLQQQELLEEFFWTFENIFDIFSENTDSSSSNNNSDDGNDSDGDGDSGGDSGCSGGDGGCSGCGGGD
ncbi:MAG: hypothetical protein OHK0038_17100 [Flammeovirgaceae bacterium]